MTQLYVTVRQQKWSMVFLNLLEHCISNYQQIIFLHIIFYIVNIALGDLQALSEKLLVDRPDKFKPGTER